MSHPDEASSSHINLGESASREFLVGKISFVAQGNAPSPFCIVPKTYPVDRFAQQFFIDSCGLERPKVLLSVTGGAQDFKMLSSKLEQIFSRGLLRAAQNSRAWIVTGGLDSGVMKFTGDAVRDQDAEVPCIGIATYSKVSHNESLRRGETINYSPGKPNDDAGAALNPDHTHFVLVESDVNSWGQEIKFRTALEDYISREWHVPLVLVAINGGPGTLQTVAEGANKKFPIIIVEGSGRASDAMAAYLRHVSDNKYPTTEWDNLLASVKPEQRPGYLDLMEQIRRNMKYITIFNPNEDATADMDKAILRSILTIHADSGFEQKLALGVQWGRADLVTELLEKDDTTLTTVAKVQALNSALYKSLKWNQPEIFELLVSKGADKSSINMVKLYNQPDAKYYIQRLKAFAGVRSPNDPNPTPPNTPPRIHERTPLTENSAHLDKLSEGNILGVVKEILNAVDPMYAKLLVDGRVTFTDVLVWSILVERDDLSQAIWRQTVLPIHSALVACHLHSVLGEWFQGEEVYQTKFDWFQKEAISVLSELEYESAKPVLEWKWRELNDVNALQLSELAECKDFYATPTIQRYLDEKLYSDENGHIPPGTNVLQIFMLVVFPFLIRSSGFYTYSKPDTKFYHFYNLPIAKFLSSTLCYIGFLVLLSVNIIQVNVIYPSASPAPTAVGMESSLAPHAYEWFLWIWVFAAILEEFSQFLEDRSAYLELLTNQMDITMYLLLVAYIVLRILSWQIGNIGLVESYVDVLIVAGIICYLRLANVFAFSKSLGPLFFVIIRLFKDVGQWLFIFFLFGASFQLAIFALTVQATQNPWDAYPSGTMGSAFTTAIGDTGDNTMDYMTYTHIGVILLSIYSLIVQVMLVNLLIAMMGDTYSAVKDNSDKEWKFYRYGLVVDYISSSPYPPPFNLIFGPIFNLKHRLENKGKQPPPPIPLQQEVSIFDNLSEPNARTITKMKVAKEKVLDKEQDADKDTLHSVSALVREHMRLLTTQRDSDRMYLEYNMRNLQTTVSALQAQVAMLTAKLNDAHPPPPPPSIL